MEKSGIGALLALMGMLCGGSAVAQIRQVTVAGGRVEGTLVQGVTAFKGIPFAAPPVGPLRWRAPQSIKPWEGIRLANRFAPGCLQTPKRGFPMSEDCLYLNVWTPARTPRERLPVMVWFHGGGFVDGMTSQPLYDGSKLAKKGVVVVSVAYRLGIFGFLADPELSRENHGHSGNYGLRDMIAGLEWVQANIAGFGGDPKRVTIFGQSAGAQAVSILAVSPRAKGLFQRLIAESSGGLLPPTARDLFNSGGAQFRPSLSSAERTGHQILQELGAKDIAAARALPADTIQYAIDPRLQGSFGPILDGAILPDDEYELYRARRFNDTPVLIGFNAEEGRLFVGPGVTPAVFSDRIRAACGPYADAILAVYPHATNGEAERAAMSFIRDAAHAWDAWEWALLQSRYGRSNAYLYYFDQHSPELPLGPVHGAEVRYVFRTLRRPSPLALHSRSQSADVALSNLVSSYWVDFARTGDPNAPGLPAWPAFSASSQRAMYLDSHAGAHAVPNARQIKVLDRYFRWLRQAHRPRIP